MQSTLVFAAMLVGVTLAQLQQSQFHDISLPTSRFSSASAAQVSASRFTPTTSPRPLVPIIRHINRANPDGSYTFGYEGGDGTFRVETRGLDGVIKGKYGYVDETGNRKEVDYLAGSATGYEPSGQGITVPPRPPPRPPGQDVLDYDDGSWRPPVARPRPSSSSGSRQSVRVQQQQVQQSQFQQSQFQPMSFARPTTPAPAPLPVQEPEPFHQITIPRPASIPRPRPAVVQQQQQHHHQQFAQPVSHSASLPVPISSNPFASSAPTSFHAPAPARHSAPVSASASGASPIEQFLRQQLSQGPAAGQQIF